MAFVENRPRYVTTAHAKEFHFVMRTAAGVATAGLVATLIVRITKKGAATAIIVTAGGGERVITDKGRGLYALRFIAADLDTDGSFTVEIEDSGVTAEELFIHTYLTPRGGGDE